MLTEVGASRLRGLVAPAVGLLAFVLAPFLIVARGYLPPDDALRHSAFAVGNRSWNQILLGRPDALFDQNPGWHAILRVTHALTGWDPPGLAAFSVAALLLLFFAAGLPWVRRWEAWALVLVTLFLVDGTLLTRVTLGRPFLVSTAFALFLLGSTRVPKDRAWLSWDHGAWLLGTALCTWIHGSWYLLFLVPASIAVTGRVREAGRMACCMMGGVLLGALFTGHPLTFLVGQVAHLTSAMGQSSFTRGMARELAPGGQPIVPLILAALLGWANRGSLKAQVPWRDAALSLGVIGWFLGHFLVWRFFLDWGFPALAIWMAWQMDDILERHVTTGGKRVSLSLLTASVFLLVTATNLYGRWSMNGASWALNARNPEQAELLPDPGGILYSNSMHIFFGTFFVNPDGPWRYVMGYEPALMTPEDYRVYQASMQDPAPYSVLNPWVDRMTPRDRLILQGNPNERPNLPQLEWIFSPPDKWVGRKP